MSDPIEAFIIDLNGLARGKRLPAEAARKLAEGGVRLPRSISIVDVWGVDTVSTGMIFETGDGDGLAMPVMGPHPMSWSVETMRECLMELKEPDGRDFFADPRAVLRRVVERYKPLGLTPVVACELEFFLIAPGLKDGRPTPPAQPRRPVAGPQTLSIEKLNLHADFFAALAKATALQGIPADAALSENGDGQFEVNLRHVADPIAACDHAVLLKRAVRGAARQVGLEATFMAKPYGEASGSGLHIHFSMCDEKGRNVFDDGGAGSETMRQAVAGCLNGLNDGMAIFAPHLNSYRRLRRRSHAPNVCAWGMDNRTVAIRIPADGGKARRIEHRVPGADANPYLALAAILAAAHDGIVKQMVPPPPLSGDAYDTPLPPLVAEWGEALHRFDQSDLLRDYLGAEFCRVFGQIKAQEHDTFARLISDVEVQAYLTI